MEFAEQPLASSGSPKDAKNLGGKDLFIKLKDPVDHSGKTQLRII